MSLSREYVRASASLEGRELPDGAAKAAILHFRDAVGVGLAAAGSPVGQSYRGLVPGLGKGPSSAFGSAGGLASHDAALVNGGLIHSLEYDDTHTASIVHGSSLAAAVTLAAAEAAGASGAALVGAFARCWEFMIRIGLAAPGGFQGRGFHVTSVGGSIAAALTAAELMQLTEDQRVAAIGISLSQASGVFEFLSNGSSVKSLHPGWAAHAGIFAAKLAATGMTGPETALEGRYGLFRHFAGSEDAASRFERSIGDLGSVWHIQDAAYKLYPCCHFLHPFVEAAGVLASRGVSADDVEAIECVVPPGEAPIICEPWEVKQAPETGHAMRWSLPAVIGERLVRGSVDLSTFERSPSAAVQSFARRVSWRPMKGAAFPERFEAEIVCRLHDGREEVIRIDDAYGNRTRPPAPAELDAKFNANAARSLAPEGVRALDAALSTIGEAVSLADLTNALRRVLN